ISLFPFSLPHVIPTSPPSPPAYSFLFYSPSPIDRASLHPSSLFGTWTRPKPVCKPTSLLAYPGPLLMVLDFCMCGSSIFGTRALKTGVMSDGEAAPHSTPICMCGVQGNGCNIHMGLYSSTINNLHMVVQRKYCGYRSGNSCYSEKYVSSSLFQQVSTNGSNGCRRCKKATTVEQTTKSSSLYHNSSSQRNENQLAFCAYNPPAIEDYNQGGDVDEENPTSPRASLAYFIMETVQHSVVHLEHGGMPPQPPMAYTQRTSALQR
ncbi:hypothetical protein C0J52_12213, partial [Blattella germanica]